MDETSLLTLIASFYDASVEPTLWVAALAGLMLAVGGVCAWLYGVDAASERHLFRFEHGFAPGFVEAYTKRWWRHDPGVAFRARNPDPTLQYDYQHTSEAEMATDDFYQWLARFGLKYSIGGCLATRDGVRVCATLYRSPRQGHVQPEDITRYRLLAPHLTRAGDMTLRYRASRLLADATSDSVEDLLLGVIVLDGRGRVRLMNRVAREVVASGDALAVRAGALRALRATDDATLQSLIASAAAVSLGHAAAGGGEFALARRASTAGPYTLTVAAAGRGQPLLGRCDAAVLVHIGQPDLRPVLHTAVLRRLYGLTKRQAQVAEGLATGASIEAVAERLRLARHTVRLHLTEVFRKTGTRRQTELVKLLLTTPARTAPGAGE